MAMNNVYRERLYCNEVLLTPPFGFRLYASFRLLWWTKVGLILISRTRLLLVLLISSGKYMYNSLKQVHGTEPIEQCFIIAINICIPIY